LKLAKRPFAIVDVPCFGHLINSGKAFFKGVVGVKVQRTIFGESDETSPGGFADGDYFGEEVDEHAALRVAFAAGGQCRIGERAEVSQASVRKLAPYTAEDIVTRAAGD